MKTGSQQVLQKAFDTVIANAWKGRGKNDRFVDLCLYYPSLPLSDPLGWV